MTLVKLVERFDHYVALPIEIPTVREELISLGIQDRIVFCGEDFDPRRLQGVFYQYVNRAVLYGEPERCSLIVYSNRLELAWQRLVCCKELIHVLDDQIGRTDTPEAVDAIVEKLLGPLSTEDFGLADFQAAKDKLALYQALAILFPDDARTEILELSPRPSDEEVAEWACLPVRLVRIILSDSWPRLRKDVLQV